MRGAVAEAYVEAQENAKFSGLHAPATNCTGTRRSPVSGDLFVFWAAANIAARFPLSSIRSWPFSGVKTMESINPRSISEASKRVSSRWSAAASFSTLVR